ncbi:hypothetical protein L204_105483 [Cryptococcus depauperatus]
MSRQEKDALVAYVNSFKLSKPVTDFAQLSDGKSLTEIMSTVDATHFKNVTSRGISSSTGASSENWVLRMNTLKRLYRLLLSFPLPAPHPSSLSLSKLPEPPFPVIAKSPATREGSQGLLQICRFCLATGVWASGNERVIIRIQRLKEEHMAELMKSIEQIMESLPAEHQSAQGGTSPLKPSPDMSYSPPLSSLRAERDKLLQENDDFRHQCEQMMEQISDLSSKFEEAKEERDNAMKRLTENRTENGGSTVRARESVGSGETERLKTDLIKAEENLARSEEKLEKQASVLSELSKQIEDYKEQAAEATRLKDQLDEYRHTSERLRKSENVIEKYRKKLEESASLRREFRDLEEENASLVNTNSNLEAELKKANSSKTLLDNYKAQISSLEKQTVQQVTEIAKLNHHLELSQSQLETLQQQYEHHQLELQINQERLKEIELSGEASAENVKGKNIYGAGEVSLDDEIGGVEGSKVDTKTDLRLKIKSLQRELLDLKQSAPESYRIVALETLLEDANKSRDRYQGEYLKAHREGLRLQATLEQIRSGRGGNNSQTTAALKQRLDEVIEERDNLLKENQELEEAKAGLERSLQIVKTDLSLVGKDQREILASLRKSVENDASDLEKERNDLKEQVHILKEKDRHNLEEIKKILVEKIDLQTAGIDQRERALEREKEFSGFGTTGPVQDIPAETQQRLLDLHEKNVILTTELGELKEKFEKLSASGGPVDHVAFEQAQLSYESQILNLQSELAKLKQNKTVLQNQYKVEQQLMLSAWHNLGQRVVREHLYAAGTAAGKRSQGRPQPAAWLGRQRRIQEGATFAR